MTTTWCWSACMNQHCCTPVCVHFTPSLHALGTRRPHKHTKQEMHHVLTCIRLPTVTQFNVDRRVMYAVNHQAVRASDWQSPNKQRHDTLQDIRKKREEGFSFCYGTRTDERTTGRPPDQSRRSVTEGSSPASSASALAVWVMGFPRRSRRFSLGQDARGWRSASVEISEFRLMKNNRKKRVPLRVMVSNTE